jgi:amino acid adenylation domain-containing protein
MDTARHSDDVLQSIAIVGMAGRFPGAADLEQFWRIVAAGSEAVQDLDEAALRAAGVAEQLLRNPRYVRRASRLDDVRGFDAEFFDISPREAEITDPQHRLLLECAYHALEHAGYNPYDVPGMVGVYAGVGISDYLLANLTVQPGFMAATDGLTAIVGNDKSYACTRISHKLGLRGPSISLDTSCSTSLVAVHMACRALLAYDCDAALAGGARILVPQDNGYLHQPGGVLSPDGSCRPFDAAAAGTVAGSGVGLVVLKRLVDAIDDGDTIHAVIRGSAINNDGRQKIGYTAPSVHGQVNVIAQALANANVDPSTIRYVESHGTGTNLGDPIEVQSLTKVYRQYTDARGYCALGSLKGNMGHLDVAAGVASLIKTTLALRHGVLPPICGFRRANPEIGFAETPFYVNAEAQPWPAGAPRRAGVSSFGIGGTNAHLVLEQAPPVTVQPAAIERPRHLLCLSARSDAALQALAQRQADFLAATDLPIGDIVYTAACGRPALERRLAVSGNDAAALARALREDRGQRRSLAAAVKNTAFLFTGQGAHYAGMGRALYQGQPQFRARIHALSELMAAHLPCPLPELLWGSHSQLLDATRYAQPALFALQLALAELWRSFGLQPVALLGHSVGEIAAACFAGVLTTEDAVTLICARARLMEELAEPGEMLAVAASAEVLSAVIAEVTPQLSLAADNGPSSAVASGRAADIAMLAAALEQRGIAATRLAVTRAFHSPLMQPMLERFRAAITGLRYGEATLPIYGNLDGQRAEQRMAAPDYWLEQILAPVQFRAGMGALARLDIDAFVEIGPKSTLLRLGRSCLPEAAALWLPSLSAAGEDWTTLLDSLGQLYVNGADIDFKGVEAGYARRRVPLPLYPFQHRSYWTLPEAVSLMPAAPRAVAANTAADSGIAPVTQMATATAVVTAPADDSLAGRVRALWSEMLGVGELRDEDNFFALGGHSLLVVQLRNRIEREFGFQLPMNALIEDPTLGEFTAAMEHLAGSVAQTEPLPMATLDQDNRHAPFPLAGLQLAYLLGRSDAFGFGGVATHLYFEMTPPQFHPERFAHAWNAVVRRHDMLRAVVIDETTQRILPEVPDYQIRRYDLHETPQRLGAHLDQIRSQMSHQVLPADTWPLFDVRITRESEHDYRVHVSIDLLMLDIRSNQILFRDLDLIYLGQEQLLPQLPISYRDYVLAEKRLMASGRYTKDRGYWLQRIPDMPLAPALPTAVAPSEIGRPSFARRIVRLEPRRWQQLRKKSQAIGVSPSAVLMTAYGLVLAQWSERADFTLNLTMFNRQPLHESINQLVGDFTTLSLLSLDFREPANLRDRARIVQRQLWRDIEHSSFNGVEVLRELTRHHGRSQQIAMPVVFTSALPLDEENGRELPPDSLFNAREEGYSISQTPQVWIDHVVAIEDEHLVLNWDAIETLFPDGLLDDMFDAYQNLVKALADGDEAWRAIDLDLLPARLHTARADYNATALPLPQGRMFEPFLAQAERTPQAVAVISAEQELSYAQLRALAFGVAQQLREAGVQRGDRVAVLMHKGWEQVVAVLAIQFCAAAYLPIDAHLPVARQAQLLQQGGVKVAVVQPQLAGLDLDVTTIAVDASISAAEEIIVPGADTDLAYVIFTSGSTGVPKGVMIDHRGALNTIVDCNRRFGVTAADRVLALSSLSFDLSVYDIFGLLAAGGAIVIPPDGDMRDPEHWAPWIARHGVTIFNAVPSFAQMLADLARTRDELQQLPSLRLFMMSGDWIPMALAPALRQLYPQCRLTSLGGATEASIWSICHDITPADDTRRSIPYGRPMDNQRFYVLGSDFSPSPDWVPGMLYIGGDGLALGYYGDEAKTAASFIAHPQTGERLYRTGDLGRMMPEGFIEFLGRADNQVKIHGHRIELGEIEAVLARHPLLRQAVVNAPQLGAGGRKVVAYLQLQEGESSDAQLLAELRAYCAGALPDYMVPAHFLVLDEIPLSSNGKVDRRALPLPDAQVTQAQPPRDALEAQLAAIWREVLERPEVGVFDNFLELGGHSLLAARMLARLREGFGRELQIRTLFDHPTIAGLAEVLRGGALARDTLPALRRRGAAALPQPSFAQQRLWFIDRFEHETAGYAQAYNLPVVLDLRGELDSDALRQAVEGVLARHEILRTGICEVDGEPLLHVNADAVLPWRETTAADAEDCEAQVNAEATAPFDLAHPPLLRGLLIRRGAQDHVLVLAMHHIATDAWSTGLMLNEIQQRYNALARGEPVSIPDAELHYADFAAWQRDNWRESRHAATEAYWAAELADLPAPIPLATDRPRRPYKDYAAVAVNFELDAELGTALRTFAKANGATPFMVFMAAFQLLLHRYTGARDLVIGTDTANRLSPETETMLGFFINQLAIRVQIDPQQDTQALLRQVRDKTLLAYEHEAMPFDRLVDQLRIARNPALSPVFQVKLNMHTVADAHFAMDGVSVDFHPYDFATAQYELVMTLKADGDGFFGTLQYQTALFDAPRMQAAVQHFQQLLRALLDAPRQPVGELDYLGAAERARLAALDGPRARFPGQVSIDRRFADVVARQPASVALSATREWQYAELSAAADRLAAWLSARVPVGARIGLYLERSENPVIAMLAVLKAGAAYVPLDPRSPAERLALILEDCAPALILADRDTMDNFPLSTSVEMVALDELDLPDAATPSRSAPELPAYVIYTSGTTGKPNGVVITHAQVGRLLDACQDWYQFGPDDVWTLFHSYVFDFSVWEIWGALLWGGRLVVVPYWVARATEDFHRLLLQQRVTVLNQTPSAFRQLQRVALQSPEGLPDLRWVIFGGEGLELQSLRPWFARFGEQQPQLVNMYGITETTVHVTHRPIRLADLDSHGSPIGEPIPDQAIYLLDARGEPVPDGIDGEIYVGGEGNAMGYLQRPALTARRYVPDPFSGVPGARLYRSGDLARRNARGELEYVGRIDHQVKIRGHRIEIGEVQANLAAHPDLAEALVLSLRNADGEQTLAGYAVLRSGAERSGSEIRRWLAERIPDYMVPAAVVLLDTFPLTINGKVDRAALPDPRAAAEDTAAAYVAPEGETAEQLCTLIAVLLELPRVGMNDNFFEIGGHSLLATRLISHIRESFGVDIGLRAVFQHATVAELARLIDTALLLARLQSIDASVDESDREEFVL